MSHKTKVKMKLNDKDALKHSLDIMGLKYEEADSKNGLSVKSRYGVNANVDIKLKNDTNGNNISDVGFEQKEDGSYEAIGDFWDLRGAKTSQGLSLSENNFKGTVSKMYQYSKAVEEMEKLGFGVENEPTDWEGDVEFAFTKTY